MQDSDALFVYFLDLSAFLPTLYHLALFCPEFVHHHITEFVHQNLGIITSNDAFVNLAIRIFASDSHQMMHLVNLCIITSQVS